MVERYLAVKNNGGGVGSVKNGNNGKINKKLLVKAVDD